MTHSNTLKLYRASAGSGKTYRLSLEFLKLLVVDPECYKNILAVTFTNKATTEMQNRIMGDLFAVARNLEGSVLNALKAELDAEGRMLSKEVIQKNAFRALSYIIHDYSRFQVSTIDSFFQVVLRNLARELGLSAFLNIVIETDETLNEAVQYIITDYAQNPKLQGWIKSYVQSQMESDKQWNVKDEIVKFGNNIFNEALYEYEEVIKKQFSDVDFLEKYKRSLGELQDEVIEQIREKKAEFDALMSELGLTIDDLYYKKGNGLFSYLDKVYSLINLKYGSNEKVKDVEIGSRFQTILEGGKITGAALPCNEERLSAYAKSLHEMGEQNTKYLLTIDLILKQYHKVGLLGSIYQKVRDVNNDRSQFILSDTPKLLSRMIGKDDAPFIYEKIGTSLEHIMIDEFQDTSQIQWNNFHTLIDECLANQQMSLIVGDAKQSIYRFRNGKWELIEQIPEKYEGLEQIEAKKNWRSMQHVIEFNNMLFAPRSDENPDENHDEKNIAVSPILAPFKSEYGDEEIYKRFCGVYRDAYQEIGKSSQANKGFVSVEFLRAPEAELPDDDEEGISFEDIGFLLQKIRSLQKQGIKAKDITILVRKNEEIEEIAKYFAEYAIEHKEQMMREKVNYEVISSEAYKLSVSEALKQIINAMRVIVAPTNTVAMVELFLSYSRNIHRNDSGYSLNQTLSDLEMCKSAEFVALKDKILSLAPLPLYEMVQTLISLLRVDEIPNQSPYIFKFLDSLNDFITRKYSDLNRFIDYWETSLSECQIPMGDTIDGINAMTIHKSKGLEFHTVIIPDCNELIININKTSNKPYLVWCETKVPPFNEIPIWPINLKDSKVKNTIFKKEYEEEQVKQVADTINLLYVAFTRAINNLFIICPYKKENKKDNSDNVSPKNYRSLLHKILEKNLIAEEHGKYVEEYYAVGEVVLSSEEKKERKEDNPFKANGETEYSTFKYHTMKSAFRNSNKATDYIEGLIESREKNQSALRKGILLHLLFSNIETVDDIDKAVNEMTLSGVICNKEEKENLISFAKEKIKEHQEWFEPGLKIYKECTILEMDEETKHVKESRPDRVIQKGNKMIIIDFKTGKPYPKYEKQMKRYADLLGKMGFETETHLWYLESD